MQYGERDRETARVGHLMCVASASKQARADQETL